MKLGQAVSFAIRLLLSAVFAVFAVIHIQHMLSPDWASIGLHWRVVDVFYSLMAIIVIAGFMNNARASVIALYSYSLSQLAIIALLAVLDKTWLPYTSFQGANVLLAVAILHVLALVGEGFVIKQRIDHFKALSASRIHA